jgi:hypothetical protein
MPSRRPRAEPEPDPVPPLDPGTARLYRVTPLDGSAQLILPDYDGGHVVQAGALVHAPVYTDLHVACGGLNNLTPLPYGGPDQQAEAAGRGKQGVSNYPWPWPATS